MKRHLAARSTDEAITGRPTLGRPQARCPLCPSSPSPNRTAGAFRPSPPPLISFRPQRVEGEGEGDGLPFAGTAVAAGVPSPWVQRLANGGGLAGFPFFRVYRAPLPCVHAPTWCAGHPVAPHHTRSSLELLAPAVVSAPCPGAPADWGVSCRGLPVVAGWKRKGSLPLPILHPYQTREGGCVPESC